jgi:hypothetical protein
VKLDLQIGQFCNWGAQSGHVAIWEQGRKTIPSSLVRQTLQRRDSFVSSGASGTISVSAGISSSSIASGLKKKKLVRKILDKRNMLGDFESSKKFDQNLPTYLFKNSTYLSKLVMVVSLCIVCNNRIHYVIT